MNRNSVLFLTYWYPSKNSKSFGIFIKRHGHAVKLNNDTVVLSLHIEKGTAAYEKKTEVFIDEAGMETHRIWLETRFKRLLYMFLPFQYLLLKNYISENLSDRKFTVLHSNIVFPCASVGHRLAQWLRCRHVITEHWTKVDDFFKSNVYRSDGKKAYDRAFAITCVSEQLAATVKKYTNNPAVHVVPNIIESKEIYYDPGIPKNQVLTFVAVSYWDNYKNPFYFLDSLQQLFAEKKLPAFKLVLVGGGPQVEEAKGRDYAFDIEYRGPLFPKEINMELNKSHIFLHGSDFETFSVIIAEALICGVPSVVSPVGIAPEVINATNGFIAQNNSADWKDKILACYNTTYDYQAISQQLKGRYETETIGRMFSEIYK